LEQSLLIQPNKYSALVIIIIIIIITDGKGLWQELTSHEQIMYS